MRTSEVSIGNSALYELEIAYFRLRKARKGAAAHFVALPEIRRQLAALVRADCRGHYYYFVEAQLVHCRAGKIYVLAVDGVERSSEYGNSHI